MSKPFKVGDFVHHPPAHSNGRGGWSHYGPGIITEIRGDGTWAIVAAELSWSGRIVSVPVKASDLRHYNPRLEDARERMEALRRTSIALSAK